MMAGSTAMLIDQKLRDYRPENAAEQEVALIEIVQHFVLAMLARTGFFERSVFHGGTHLRIAHELPRFSEDLDFVLKAPARAFAWSRYLDEATAACSVYGFEFEIKDRGIADSAVRAAFLKTDSIGKQVSVTLPFARSQKQKIHIKLEIDTNPPAGADFETQFITFPVPTTLTGMTLASSFAGKSHALLCREYV